MPILRERPELLRRFRAGDRDALAEVYQLYADRVGQLLRRACAVRAGSGVASLHVSPHDFLDIAQEVFVKAFSPAARGGYDGIRDYTPYLLMIARNTMADWMRRRRGHIPFAPEVMAELVTDQSASTQQERLPWENSETLGLVEEYLVGLPPDLAAFHRLRYGEGLSQEATAESLGLSRQNVRTLEERLRSGLAQILRRDVEVERPEPPQLRRDSGSREGGSKR